MRGGGGGSGIEGRRRDGRWRLEMGVPSPSHRRGSDGPTSAQMAGLMKCDKCT